MLEYIKRQIAEKQKANQNVSQVVDPTDQLDSAILEYAHLADELSDLTMEGHNALRERPILDIPIEDDVELDSIEMSITSGRIMDVPADITAMEHAYEDQKTFNDFFQEAYKNTGRLTRESDAHYSERVMNIADKEYHAYMEYVIQEGLFGNDMLSINDDRVPASIMVDFGKYSGGNYITKIPVGFECDHNNKVNINQIHAVTISQNMRVFAHVAEFLANQIHTNQHINIRGSVWDVATPVMMIVPKFTGRYTTIVKFEIEGGTDEFVSWSIEESKIRKSKNEALDLNKIEGVESPVEKYDTKKVSSMHLTFKDKNKPINEYVAPKKIPSRWDLYNDNTDYDYIEESTSSDITWTLIGCMAAGAAVGGVVGAGIGAAVSTLDVLLASMAYGGAIGGMLGTTAGSWAAVYKIRDNVPTLFAKNITKAISKCVKIANESPSSEEVYISELKKFKKANKKLSNELRIWDPENAKRWDTHTMYNDYTSNRVPENVRTALKKATEKVGEMILSLEAGKQKFEKKFLNEYLESLNDLLDAIWCKNDEAKIKSEGYYALTLDEVIQEMAETDFIQEAIDFGGGDNADTPPSGDNSGVNDAGAATNAGSNDTGDSGNIDLGATDNANNDAAPTVDADAQKANVNDVSDAIAAKVSNETNKDSADLGMDAAPTFDSNPDVKLDLDSADAGSTDTSSEDVNNLEPDLSQDSSNDMGSTDNFNTQDVTGNDSTEPSSDEMKDELNGDFGDNTDVNSSDLGGGSMDNIDDMSIDDLLAKGEDKLKGMSIAQLKDFLNDGLGEEESATVEYATGLQNSIKNHVRNCLGILNTTKLSVKDLVTAFKTEGHELNKKLTLAGNSDEINANQKLIYEQCNKALANLQAKLKANPSESDKGPLQKAIVDFCRSSSKITTEAAEIEGIDENGVVITEWTLTKDYIKGMTPKRETFERLIRMAETYKKQLGNGKTIEGKDFAALKSNTDKYLKFLGAESKMLSHVSHGSDNRRLNAAKQIKNAYHSASNGFSNEEDDALFNAKLNKQFGTSTPEDDETINRLGEKKQKHYERMSKIDNADYMLNVEDFSYSSRAASELKNLNSVVRRLMYSLQTSMSYNGKPYKALDSVFISSIRKSIDEYISKHEEFLRLLKK